METVERILNLLKEKKILQKDFAKEMGFGETNISDWKKGKSKSYKKYIYQIADYLDTSPDYLLCKTDDPKPQKSKFRPEPDIKWGDFGISFYEGRDKKLTQKQKDDITKFVKFTVMEHENGESDE